MSETRQWFSSVQAEIRHDYTAAQKVHRSDIQRSGHKGESTWGTLLETWLPSNYEIGLRKYIVGHDDTVDPFETDIIVYEPAYPKSLRSKSEVHSSGVAAAFSVKLTARTPHFKEIATWSKSLSQLNKPDLTTVEGQLLPGFPTCFLAHSHALGANPLDKFSSGIRDAGQVAQHPRELVDLACIADVGTLSCMRAAYIPITQLYPDETDFAMSSYIELSDEHEHGAVAHFIISLYKLLGRNDPSLKKLANGLAHSTKTGNGQGEQRKWEPERVYDQTFLDSHRNQLFSDGHPRVF